MLKVKFFLTIDVVCYYFGFQQPLYCSSGDYNDNRVEFPLLILGAKFQAKKLPSPACNDNHEERLRNDAALKMCSANVWLNIVVQFIKTKLFCNNNCNSCGKAAFISTACFKMGCSNCR